MTVLSLSTFFEQCNDAYYGQNTIGRGGDFVTAPEMSQVFGEMIALWLYFAHEALGSPHDFNIVECGPGRGTLMSDILRTAKKWPSFTGKNVYLLEKSPYLRAVQKEQVPDAYWVDHIQDIPLKPTLMIANEFFDALPIDQYRLQEGEVQKRYVRLEGEKAEAFWQKSEASFEETFTEKSPAREDFLKSVLAHFDQTPMMFLTIDYGDFHLRGADTLQGIYQKKKSSPFENRGKTDLTSHVDFGALKKVAQNMGFHTSPLVLQGNFLKALGIEARTEQLAQKAPSGHHIRMATHRLMSNKEMGQLFKVMCFYNGAQQELLGLKENDHGI